jgi:hypothetical protein
LYGAITSSLSLSREICPSIAFLLYVISVIQRGAAYKLVPPIVI